MTVVHCSGHDFDKIKDKVDGKTVRVRYICSKCGLRVKTRYAASYLQNRPS